MRHLLYRRFCSNLNPFSIFLVSYEFDSDNSDIEELSEKLFKESEPNIFPHIKVNLQSSTSSWSSEDDADLP